MTDFFFLFFFSRFFDRKIQSGNDGKYEKFQELERSRSAKPWKPSDEDGLFLFFSFFKKQKNIDIIIVVVVSLTARRAGNWRTQRAGRAATLKIKKEKPTQTHTHTHTHTHARNKKKAKKKLERKKNGETKRDNKTPRMTSRLILSAYFTRKKTRERERERDKLPFSASRLSRRRPVQGVSLFLAGHVLFYFFLGNRFHFFLCVLRRLISFVGGSSPDSSTGRTNSTEKDPLLLLSLLLLLLSCSTRSSMRLTACKCWLTPNRNREQRWDRSNSGVLLGFSWFYWVLLGFTEFFTGGCKVLKEVVCEWLLLVFTWFFWIASRLEPIQSLFFSKSKQNQKENVSPSRMTMRDRSFVGI